MKVRIISFNNGDLNPDLLKHQDLVFKKFGIPLEQIETKLPHPEAIDHFLNTEEWDILFLFDADCIPLNETVCSFGLRIVASNRMLYGASQRASHIPNSIVYVSPCFMVLTRVVWEKMGKPSFKATERCDVAGEVTHAAIENDVECFMMFPSHVEKEMWPLIGNMKFGYGTTYGDSIYHAFESNANHGSTTRFIQKCQEVLAS
jgi:hypothetical protein